MPEEAIFEHRGHAFKQLTEQPHPSQIAPGQWVRICYDPNTSKEDIVALVLSCQKIWRNSPYHDGPAHIDDYILRLARDGDHSDSFDQFYDDDEYIEVVEKISLQGLNAGERSVAKDIVVCLDGTWNENERENTNVHRIMGFVDKNRAVMNYYSGVGVGGMKLQNWFDGMTGRGVFRTVRSAFTFVRANFSRGDRIFVFGFSRGAYAARHLAGMIACIGTDAHPELGYEEYRRRVIASTSGHSNPAGTDVHFLGLFDCVPGNQIYAVGAANRAMNNPYLESKIQNFAHAVSKDERRWSFDPLIFEKDGQAHFTQRWFPGCHFDIGGDKNPALNNFALVWMLTEAVRCGLSITGGLSERFSPNAPTKPHEYITTKLGLRRERSTVSRADLVERQIEPAELRQEISALTQLRPAG